MDAAKALEKIKAALDSGMGPLPTLASVREVVDECYPPTSPAAPPSGTKKVASSVVEGKSAKFIPLGPDSVVKFMGEPPSWSSYGHFYDLYLKHKPTMKVQFDKNGKAHPVPADASSWQGYTPSHVVMDEMEGLADWEKELLSPAPAVEGLKKLAAQYEAAEVKEKMNSLSTAMAQMSATLSFKMSPEQSAQYLKLFDPDDSLGKKANQPND